MCNFLGTVSFPLTWSSAYAELSFDDLTAVFGTNGRWSSAECPKTVNFFTEKNISFSWTGRLLFWRSLLKMFDVAPLFSSALSEKEEKVIIFFLIYFPQIVPMDKWNAFSTIPTKTSCDKAGKFSLIVRNWYKILISSKQRIFPRHVLRHT